ncbi:MAG: sugar ABC transporter permease [Sinomonas sp.]|nr:sugar ABC transporter permease [Sinomonas sp.]
MIQSATRERPVATRASGTPRPPAGRRARMRSNYPWWLVAPAVLLFGGLFLAPNVLNYVYPFTNWSAYHSEVSFAGLDNVRTVLQDGSLQNALKVTLIFAGVVTVMYNVGGLLLALLLYRDTRINRICRSLMFLPVLLSPLAIGYIFDAFLQDHGALNGVLSGIIGHEVAVSWLGSTTWTIFVVAGIHTWKWLGFSMLVYLAGLKTVPAELYESARLDGAGGIRAFRHVTFPLIAPAFTFNIVTACVGSLNSFDTVLATTQGGPGDSTQVFNMYMFRIFGQGLYGQAATISLALLLVVVLIAAPLIAYLRRRENVL